MYVKLRLQQKGTFFFSFLLSKFLEYQFMKIIPVLIIAGHKSTQYSEGHLEFFATFHNLSLLFPRFRTEPLTKFRGTLVATHTTFNHPL